MAQFTSKKECREKFDEMGKKILAFCGTDSFNNVLQKLCSMYPDTLSLTNGTLYYMGRLPRPLAFNDENVFSIESKCESDVKTAVSALIGKKGNADKYMRDVVLGFLTLKTIFFEKDNLCKSAMSKIEQETVEPVVEVVEKPVEPKKPVKKEYISFDSLKANDKKQKYSLSVPFGAADGQVFSLKYPDQKSALFISEGDKFESNNKAKFHAFAHKLVFGSMLSFPVNMVEFAFIESTKVDFSALSAVQKTFAGFKDKAPKFKNVKLDQYMHGDMANQSDTALAMLNNISDLCNERQTIIIGCNDQNGIPCETIEDYNAVNPKNPLRYVVLFVHGYPDLCQRAESFELLKRIIKKGGESGVYTIILGKNTPIQKGFGGESEQLDFADLEIDELTIDNNAVATYNGLQFGIEDFLSDFTLTVEDLEHFADRQKTASQYYLNDILEEESDGKFNKLISIPLGDYEGTTYTLDTSTGADAAVPFTIVLGKSGSGKSAFLHSLIMSAATKYSPEELQFHLIDFKTTGGSAEFKDYVKTPGEENLYIPHVKYMSMQSKPENALDVLNYIKYLMNKNSQIGKFREYNDRPEVKSGKLPKMPMTYVIIDEYKWLLAGGADNADSSIAKKIKSDLAYILMTARAFGVGLIFSGQTQALDEENHLSQIGNRICFANTPDVFGKLFLNWRNAMYTRFPKGDAVKGYAYVADGLNGTPKFVRMAFSGDPTSDRMRAMAKHIRQKYKNSDTTQIIAGVMGSASLKYDYQNWQDTIERVINEEKLSKQNNQNELRDFEQSGKIEAYQQMRPIPLGISSMTLLPVNMEYSCNENSKNYFAFAAPNVLRRIEQNATIGFIKQTTQYKNSKVYFCVEKMADYDAALGEVVSKYPFIKNRIEVVCGPYNMAQLVVKIAKQLEDEVATDPRYLVMHDVSWMASSDWLKKDKAKPVEKQAKPVEEKKFSQNVLDQLKEIKAGFGQEALDEMKTTFGLKTEAELNKYLVDMYNIDEDAAAEAFEEIMEEPQQQDESESFTYDDFKKAFAKVYLTGNVQETFVLVTAKDYNKVVKDVILATEKNAEDKKVLSDFAVFANSSEKESHKTGVPSANTCLVMPSSTQIRMYDYLADESAGWWKNLQNELI